MNPYSVKSALVGVASLALAVTTFSGSVFAQAPYASDNSAVDSVSMGQQPPGPEPTQLPNRKVRPGIGTTGAQGANRVDVSAPPAATPRAASEMTDAEVEALPAAPPAGQTLAEHQIVKSAPEREMTDAELEASIAPTRPTQKLSGQNAWDTATSIYPWATLGIGCISFLIILIAIWRRFTSRWGLWGALLGFAPSLASALVLGVLLGVFWPFLLVTPLLFIGRIGRKASGSTISNALPYSEDREPIVTEASRVELEQREFYEVGRDIGARTLAAIDEFFLLRGRPVAENVYAVFVQLIAKPETDIRMSEIDFIRHHSSIFLDEMEKYKEQMKLECAEHVKGWLKLAHDFDTIEPTMEYINQQVLSIYAEMIERAATYGGGLIVRLQERGIVAISTAHYDIANA